MTKESPFRSRSLRLIRYLVPIVLLLLTACSHFRPPTGEEARLRTEQLRKEKMVWPQSRSTDGADFIAGLLMSLIR